MSEFAGQIGLTDYTSRENAHSFAIRMALARTRTAVGVIVMGVHAGAEPDQWSVDVQLLINMVDGAGNPTPHGTIFGVQVFNFSGANGSFCVQPAVGDLGLMIVMDRDHSKAINTKAVANPGSGRVHDLSDGVYLGGFGAMNSNGQRIVMTASGIQITGNVAITGALAATGNIIADSGGGAVDLLGHIHGGVSSGGSQTSAPTAGT